MLVLTRSFSEKIMIGDDVSLVVLSVENNRVQLGIKTHKDVHVYRQELFGRVQRGKSKLS